jgi:hypothetical protein
VRIWRGGWGIRSMLGELWGVWGTGGLDFGCGGLEGGLGEHSGLGVWCLVS